jgi:hypothetical protein
MKNTVVSTIISAIILATALQTASAFTTNPDGREYVIDLNRGISSSNYWYADYNGYPTYRVYGNDHPYSYNRHYYSSNYNHNDNNDGELSYWEKLQAARFVINSFNNRYDQTAGQSSGDAFCQGCKIASNSPTNWGNKPAYDFVADGPGTNKDYYYKATLDPKTQTYNWRF